MESPFCKSKIDIANFFLLKDNKVHLNMHSGDLWQEAIHSGKHCGIKSDEQKVNFVSGAEITRVLTVMSFQQEY